MWALRAYVRTQYEYVGTTYVYVVLALRRLSNVVTLQSRKAIKKHLQCFFIFGTQLTSVLIREQKLT